MTENDKSAGKAAAKPDSKDKKKGEKAVEKKAAPPPPPTPTEVLQRNIFLIDKYAETRDNRFLSRALRLTGFLRNLLPLAALRTAADAQLSGDAARRSALNSLFDIVASVRPEPKVTPVPTPVHAPAAPSEDIEMKGAETKSTPEVVPASSSSSSSSSSGVAVAAPKPYRIAPASAVDLEVYFSYLAISMLVAARAFPAVADASLQLADYLTGVNKRSLDFFQARAYSFLSLAYEVAGKSEALTPMLVAAHRTATLRHDDYGQAVLVNLLLRSYLRDKLYEQASKLVLKTTFPESASNAQLVRFLYYKGRIQAVQLDYSDAYASLMQAVRKAPPTAIAFRVIATKVALIVQLLTGEIPERAIFSGEPALTLALQPYFDLTAAVRSGELVNFSKVVGEQRAVFERDETYTLILRLQANVIKTGLRSIAKSYSRISFGDIASKLALGTAEDAECLCAKAIRDGVIDGVLDHDAAALVSREIANVYLTKEPQEAFHRRLTFCLDVHNEAVRGMRYPPHAHRDDLEDAEARAGRDKDEAELATEIEEGDLDEEDM